MQLNELGLRSEFSSESDRTSNSRQGKAGGKSNPRSNGSRRSADKALVRQMSSLRRARDSLPEPQETIVYVLWTDQLVHARQKVLNSLYQDNKQFQSIVDEIRANSKHYLAQTSSGEY